MGILTVSRAGKNVGQEMTADAVQITAANTV